MKYNKSGLRESGKTIIEFGVLLAPSITLIVLDPKNIISDCISGGIIGLVWGPTVFRATQHFLGRDKGFCRSPLGNAVACSAANLIIPSGAYIIGQSIFDIGSGCVRSVMEAGAPIVGSLSHSAEVLSNAAGTAINFIAPAVDGASKAIHSVFGIAGTVITSRADSLTRNNGTPPRIAPSVHCLP
jgi:hypothetical protein